MLTHEVKAYSNPTSGSDGWSDHEVTAEFVAVRYSKSAIEDRPWLGSHRVQLTVNSTMKGTRGRTVTVDLTDDDVAAIVKLATARGPVVY